MPSATSYTWLKLSAYTTITHAVEYIIVNNRTNTTRTSTSFVELPANITKPPTNSLGTRVWEKQVSSPVPGGSWSTFLTNITYPSSFTQVSEVSVFGMAYWLTDIDSMHLRTLGGVQLRPRMLADHPSAPGSRTGGRAKITRPPTKPVIGQAQGGCVTVKEQPSARWSLRKRK